MTKKQHHDQPHRAGTGNEARRWLQRAREIGEAAARAEYHWEERQKERQDRGGYDWWRSNVHQRIHDRVANQGRKP